MSQPSNLNHCTHAPFNDAPMRYQEDLEDKTIFRGKGINWEDKQAECIASLREDSINRLVSDFGVSVESLRRLGVGFDIYAYTFPMRSPDNRIVGMRKRVYDYASQKHSAIVSQLGLFIPKDVTPTNLGLICEGETDTAAGLTLGFESIGIPGAGNCLRQVVEYVGLSPMACPCILADADKAGQDSATALADALTAAGIPCCILTPPEPHKDLRDWLKDGGLTANQLQQAIDAQSMLWPSVKLYPPGYVQVPNALMRRGSIARCGLGPVTLALTVKSYFNGEARSFPPRAELAGLLGVSVGTIDRWKRKAENFGLLHWRRGHIGRANEYTVNLGPERWKHKNISRKAK